MTTAFIPENPIPSTMPIHPRAEMMAIERPNAGAIWSSAGRPRGPIHRQTTQPGNSSRATAQNDTQTNVMNG